MSQETINLIKAAVPSAVITERNDRIDIAVDTQEDSVMVQLIMAQQ